MSGHVCLRVSMYIYLYISVFVCVCVLKGQMKASRQAQISIDLLFTGAHAHPLLYRSMGSI